ncbi:hypothetical protein cand_006910 [Cryptosporidium andersoni]|uniref:CCZ1/INTU/HSP4 first Longin domain-containing protein n=1 Tax=Cryptosporidium andersoni TaxID=117008 RepID=A0A1J4MPG8_9CRYT|nr:hypothetical protein cand_006910 [Cryptosporidium andersoni]
MYSPEVAVATAFHNKTINTTCGRSISAIFIYDPTRVENLEALNLSDDTKQDNKIIYYYPSYKPSDERRSYLGLIEGLVSISSLLMSGGKPLDYIKTRKYEIVVKSISNSNIWICLIMKLSYILKIQAGKVVGVEYTEDVSSEDKDNNSISNFKGVHLESTEYRDKSNRESLLSLLDSFIELFTLLHGNIQDMEETQLIDILEDFVPSFIDTIDLNTLSVFTFLNGFYYAPVEKLTQLSVINLVEKVRTTFNIIAHMSIFYDAHMLYSTLPLNSSRILYSYLVMNNGVAYNDKLYNSPYGRFPTAAALEINGGSSSFGRCNSIINNQGFLFGPLELEENSNNLVFCPQIYLPDLIKSFKLCAFIYKDIMIVIVLDNDYLSSIYSEKYEGANTSFNNIQECSNKLFQIREFIINTDGGLKHISNNIIKQFTTIMNEPDKYRFFYLNNINNAIRRSNKLLKSTKTLMSATEGEYVERISKLIDSDSLITEVMYKPSNGGWIVCKKSLNRIFYLFFEDIHITITKIKSRFTCYTLI